MSETIEVETCTPPIIFVGMHRSGTSMLTGFLSELGLETGWSPYYEESLFFHRLNRYIERVCNGSWDHPEPLMRLKDCPVVRSKVLTHLRNQVTSPRIVFYFGVRRFFRWFSLSRFNRPWGWKDPRNTFTFDLWRQLFPGARVVHLYRNGIDVAASLRERERLGRARLTSVYSSVRCSTLDGSYSLWQTYLERAFSLVPDGGAKDILHVRYEDILLNPRAELEKVAEFCGLSKEVDCLKSVIAKADPDRAFAFRHDAELWEFYRRVRFDPWMARLGYDAV